VTNGHGSPGQSLFDHFAYRGAAWTEFNRFNAVRGPYNDYGAAEHLERNPEILRRYGYTVNDVDLIADWFFEDPKIADPDKLLPIVLAAACLAMMRPRWRIFGVWGLCLAMGHDVPVPGLSSRANGPTSRMQAMSASASDK